MIVLVYRKEKGGLLEWSPLTCLTIERHSSRASSKNESTDEAKWLLSTGRVQIMGPA